MARVKAGHFAVLLGLALSASAPAAIYTLTANLTTGEEATPVVLTNSITGDPRPQPFGTATFVLDTTVPRMTMSVTVTDIDVTGDQTLDANDDLLAAHIHAGPFANPLPATFPVRWGFFGSPDSDTSPKQLVVTPFLNGVGGTFTSIWDAPEGNPTGVNDLASQINNILEGRSYVNFHTEQNGAGEIRGTLQVVPEPTTVGLTIGGAVLLASSRRLKGRSEG